MLSAPATGQWPPGHKLTYFKLARWEDKWIETEKEIVQDEFRCAYADLKVNDTLESTQVSDFHAFVDQHNGIAIRQYMFDNLPSVIQRLQTFKPLSFM